MQVLWRYLGERGVADPLGSGLRRNGCEECCEAYKLGFARRRARRTARRSVLPPLLLSSPLSSLTDRYRPVPTPYALPFLLSLHLPLLSSYSARITSSLDAFENLTFGLGLPGALGVADGRTATAGTSGVVRLVRAGVSARWMGEKCAEWGEDAVRSPYWLIERERADERCSYSLRCGSTLGVRRRLLLESYGVRRRSFLL